MSSNWYHIFLYFCENIFSVKQVNANKPHIAIFGRCNVGKSTLVNYLCGEALSIVSCEPGTTTDPVKRSFEIEGFAPVVIYDTAGLDDDSLLGIRRISKTMETIGLIDLAIVVLSHNLFGDTEVELLKSLQNSSVTTILIHNNFPDAPLGKSLKEAFQNNIYEFSPDNESHKQHILDAIKTNLPTWSYTTPSWFGSTLNKNDIILLVTPIDISAPAGRLILPQVQAIRNALDRHAIVIVVQTQQISTLLDQNIKFKMVVTDSQVLSEVTNLFQSNPTNITTFSILLASIKGDMPSYIEGLEAVDNLQDNNKILIIENCLHQTSCEDIGRIKIPEWLNSYTGKHLTYEFVSGLNALPASLNSFSLAVQCGGCMVTRRQLHHRISMIKNAGTPITNYGLLIKKIRP